MEPGGPIMERARPSPGSDGWPLRRDGGNHEVRAAHRHTSGKELACDSQAGWPGWAPTAPAQSPMVDPGVATKRAGGGCRQRTNAV